MLTTLLEILSWAVYAALAGVALWGTYCVVMVWRRVAETRFRSEAEQVAFLQTVDEFLQAGDLDSLAGQCQGDPRALPQLVSLAVQQLSLGLPRLRQLVADRFSRDVLADLEYRLSWVQTVIRAAPMLGLLGTVIGMMGAFSKLAAGSQVETRGLAEDISFALVTTAIGLAIAIPLVLCSANINVRIRKLEDLVGSGLAHFFESLRRVTSRSTSLAS